MHLSCRRPRGAPGEESGEELGEDPGEELGEELGEEPGEEQREEPGYRAASQCLGRDVPAIFGPVFPRVAHGAM